MFLDEALFYGAGVAAGAVMFAGYPTMYGFIGGACTSLVWAEYNERVLQNIHTPSELVGMSVVGLVGSITAGAAWPGTLAVSFLLSL